MKKQTPKNWLKEPQYAHIESVDMTRGAQFFATAKDPNTRSMDEPEFKARLAMADIKYKTKIFQKRQLEARACKLPVDTMLRTPQGSVLLQKGDYMLYDEDGHVHPMRKADFVRIYEPAGKESMAPMGVSKWERHGRKYKYWEYFERKVIERIKNLLLENGHGGGNWRRIITQL